MIQDYVAIKDGIILRLFETAQGREGVEKSIQRLGWDVDEIREVPLQSDCRSGEDLRKYTPGYKYRPLKEQLDDGLIQIPDTLTVDEKKNVIREKTLKEKIDTGVRVLKEWEYYDQETGSVQVDESKRPKPPEPTREEIAAEIQRMKERIAELETKLEEGIRGASK